MRCVGAADLANDTKILSGCRKRSLPKCLSTFDPAKNQSALSLRLTLPTVATVADDLVISDLQIKPVLPKAQMLATFSLARCLKSA